MKKLDDWIAECKEVEAKATHGPFRLPVLDDDEFTAACVLSADNGHLVADCNIFGTGDAPSERECIDTARFFVLARTALPLALKIIEAVIAHDDWAASNRSIVQSVLDAAEREPFEGGA